MNKAETLAGLAVVAIGTAILVQAKNLPYMLEDVPGPGFLPLWIAFGILGVGIFLTAQAIRTQTASTGPVQWPDPRGWQRVGLMLAALAISLLALDWLGFLLTTTLFMAAMVFALGARSWRTLILSSLLSAGILYLVFAIWLNVPLPKGILSFID